MSLIAPSAEGSLAALCESTQGELPRRALSFPALNGEACRAPGKPKPRLEKPWAFPYAEAELVRDLDPAKAHADELPAILASELGD